MSDEELKDFSIDESNMALIQLASVGRKKKKGGSLDLGSVKPSLKIRWGWEYIKDKKMKGLIWNYRGLVGLEKRRFLREIIL